jgi:hypothetical protein
MSSYVERNYSSELLQQRLLRFRRANYFGFRFFFGALGGAGPRFIGFRFGFGNLGGP